MADKAWRAFALILALAGFLSGCAGAPSPPRPPVLGPLPQASRGPQDVALERALGEFYGAPYRSGGVSPEGVDCSGLIQALFQRAGVMLPRTVALQYNAGRQVPPGELRFGDVVFFNRFCQTRGRDFYLANILPSFNAEEVCHNGIYLGGGRFVHASPRGVAVSRLDAETWRVSFKGARRYLP
ncbi:MAG: C40 family peptidase [Deltaproteobacteria bacterium]|nr:C40 family peptidase [Deltaproteobacteria bacterium]